ATDARCTWAAATAGLWRSLAFRYECPCSATPSFDPRGSGTPTQSTSPSGAQTSCLNVEHSLEPLLRSTGRRVRPRLVAGAGQARLGRAPRETGDRRVRPEHLQRQVRLPEDEMVLPRTRGTLQQHVGEPDLQFVDQEANSNAFQPTGER